MASITPPRTNFLLRTICEALGDIKDKWFAIGIQLGIPRSKLLEFGEEDDPLSAVVDYWLNGNVTESAVPISWQSIATALKSKRVGERRLSKKCRSQEDFQTEDVTLQTVCEALGDVKTKWFAIGIQLGIPRSKLLEFKKEDDPLSAVVDYLLRGNVTESVVPISWKSIAAALKSKHVGERQLAKKISSNNESQEETRIENGLSLRTVCEALGDVKTKWFAIGIQLGIPRSKLLEFEKEDDPLAAVIDYWLRGNVMESAIPISWKSIAAVLKSKYVGEQGLSNEISRNYEMQEDTTTKDAHHRTIQQSSDEAKDGINPDVKRDLENASESKVNKIMLKYSSYVACILAILKKKKVSHKDLRSFILTLPASSQTFKGQKLALLSDKKSELEKKTDIHEIIDFLSTECASFMNYDVFQAIMKHYNIKDNKKELKYPDYLRDYCSNLTISEFAKVNPQLKERKNSEQLALKFDIEMTCELAKLNDLKKVIAKVLGLNCSALDIVDIEEGCVAVKFLIPSSVASAVFTSDKMFTPQQEEELRANSVLKVECNGHTCFDEPENSDKPPMKKLKRGKPAINELSLTRIHKNSRDGVFKFRVGELSPHDAAKPEKVLLLMGATGAGKKTLINGIANYVFGVTWDDDFRYQIISDKGKNIRAYSLCSTILPYTLTIIDTPSFGDTGESANDIVSQIKRFFSDPSGVDTLHGIGFIIQASLARLTPTQRYFFDSVLSIFGKDIVENIFLLATFADAQTPPVLQATTTANIFYQESFKFNNCALYTSNDPTELFSSMFWKMGYSSFETFFVHFSRAEPKSLALTKEVLKKQDQLETLIPKLQNQLRSGLSQLDILQQEERVLKQYEADLNAKQNFTYTIDVTRFRKIILPPGVYTTICMKCIFNCHENCTIPPHEDKTQCPAMDDDGCCKICPNNCHWSFHSNMPYVIEYYTATETRTSDELKKQYDLAKSRKESAEAMIAENEKKLNIMQMEAWKLIEQARKSTKRLEEIALKPNPLTELQYLDLLIQSEKLEARPGHERRIAQYMKLCKNAEIVKNFVPKVSTIKPNGRAWWEMVASSFPYLIESKKHEATNEQNSKTWWKTVGSLFSNS